MATTYEKTDNLGLNLYGDNDPADLRDGYNDSMQTLDSTVKQVQDNVDNLKSIMPTKLAKVAHDDTLTGDGTTSSQLKVKLNHSTIMRDTGNTVYPTLLKNQTGTTINGIGFNAGDGLTAYNSEDQDTGSGIRLSNATQASIENSENCLTALEAETTTKATALNTAIQRTLKPHQVILIGDSWTQYGNTAGVDENNNLGTILKSKLGTGSNVFNYGDSGAGWVKKGWQKNTSFTDQANQAANEHTANEITDIVIVGGVNAANETITTCVNTLFSAFPNAKYLYIPNVSNNANNYKQQVDYASQANNLGLPCIPYMPQTSVEYSTDTMWSDYLHLNTQGWTRLAGSIASYINGTYAPMIYSYKLKAESATDGITIPTQATQLYVSPEKMQLQTAITFTGTLPTTNIITIKFRTGIPFLSLINLSLARIPKTAGSLNVSSLNLKEHKEGYLYIELQNITNFANNQTLWFNTLIPYYGIYTN